MLSWLFRYEATHGGGTVASVLADTFPFYREIEEDAGSDPTDSSLALSVARKRKSTVAVDTTNDLHPTKTVLLSRSVLLNSMTTLQALFAYFTLSLWNYMNVTRLRSATTLTAWTPEGDSAAFFVTSHPSDAGLGPAYLALSLAGLLFTSLAAITTCLVNDCYYSHLQSDASGGPSLQLQQRTTETYPRFLFPADYRDHFDADFERHQAAAAVAKARRRAPSRQRSHRPRSPQLATVASAEQVQQEKHHGLPAAPRSPPPPHEARRVFTISIPLPQIRLPHLSRRQKPRNPFAPSTDSNRDQQEQQCLLYVAFAVVAALTTLDCVVIAQTARQMHRDSGGSAAAAAADAVESVVIRLTVLQIMTPVVGLLLLLYTLRWAAKFAFLNCLAGVNNAIAASLEAVNR